MLFMVSLEQVPVFKSGPIYSLGLFIFNLVILESFSFQRLLSEVAQVEQMLSFFFPLKTIANYLHICSPYCLLLEPALILAINRVQRSPG